MLVDGALLAEGDAATRSPPIRACAPSISARAAMAELLAVAGSVRGLRPRRRAARTSPSACRRARRWRVAGPQRRRQDHLDRQPGRRDAPLRGHDRARRPRDDAAARRRRAPRRHRLGAAGAQHLPLAHRAGEHHRRRAARAMDAAARVRDLSAARRAARAASATRCPAASSRCWRSVARWRSIRACCCSTSRPKVWRRSSSQELLAGLARLFREERLAAIIVEQHAQKILRHHRPRLDPRTRTHRAPGDERRTARRSRATRAIPGSHRTVSEMPTAISVEPAAERRNIVRMVVGYSHCRGVLTS